MSRSDKDPSLLYRVLSDARLMELIRDFVGGPFERLSQISQCFDAYKQAIKSSPMWCGYWQVWIGLQSDESHVRRICAREYDWLLEEMYREYREDSESLHIDVAFRDLVDAGCLDDNVSETLRTRLLSWLKRDNDMEMYNRVFARKRKLEEE